MRWRSRRRRCAADCGAKSSRDVEGGRWMLLKADIQAEPQTPPFIQKLLGTRLSLGRRLETFDATPPRRSVGSFAETFDRTWTWQRRNVDLGKYMTQHAGDTRHRACPLFALRDGEPCCASSGASCVQVAVAAGCALYRRARAQERSRLELGARSAARVSPVFSLNKCPL